MEDVPIEALYFAYGSNMSRARLGERVPAARSLGAARIASMRLVFNKPGRDGTGKANLVAEASDSCWGVVHAVPGEALAILDRFEPGYIRVDRHVLLGDGRQTQAALYLWREPTPEIPPSEEYLDHLLVGAREHLLPDAWIASLESRRRD